MKDVVYTAVFDDYDILLQPKEVPDHVDFLCFTDDRKKARGDWEPIVINESELPSDLLNRKCKIFPHEFLGNYRYSMYIDGNIQIVGNVSRLFEDQLNIEPLAVAEHPRRNCLYKEAEVCIKKNLVNKKVAEEQISRYRNEGFPEKFGLTENRVLLRDHNHPQVVSAMEKWWEELNRGTRRDQLSFQYVLWKSGLNPEILCEDYSTKGGVLYKHNHKPDRFKNNNIGLIYEKKYQYKKEHNSSILMYALLSSIYYPGSAVKIAYQDGVNNMLSEVAKWGWDRIRHKAAFWE